MKKSKGFLWNVCDYCAPTDDKAKIRNAIFYLSAVCLMILGDDYWHKSPDFVKGSMSVKVDEAVAFLQKHNNNGWVNLDLLASKDNSKLYFKLNTWKPKEETATEPTKEELEDIGF